MSNVAYKSAGLAKYFAGFRDKWADFYPSERWIIERVAAESKGLGRVLDVGCASGGLGRALAGRKLLRSYAGVDINPQVIEAASARKPRGTRFVCGDILSAKTFRGEAFDTVFNLSCADWNVETALIIGASWRKVAPGGTFVISLRLTGGKGVNDPRRSYQIAAGERANYAVFNAGEAIGLLAGLPGAGRVLGYGYWGKPSKTARTPFKKLVFAVFAVTKGKENLATPAMELRLPLSLAL